MIPGIAGIMAGLSGISAPVFGPTSYANSGGTGNRTGIIATSENFPSGGGDVNQLLNGLLSELGWFFSGSANNGTQFISFDFGTAKLIDEFKWYQQFGAAHGTFAFEGSPDNSAWTALGSSFTLNNGTFPITNTTGYRYYRLRGLSGSTDGGPYIHEIEFKIS